MSYYHCYFSPTGGTRTVAEAVAQGWGEAFQPVDLLPGDPGICWTKDDVCLVAVPSYGGRVPEPVAQTIRGMNGNGARAVLIAVFGNRAIDDTLLELQDLLTEAGFCCVAAMEAVAQHSLIPRYGAGRPDAADLAQLRSFGAELRDSMGQPHDGLSLPGNRPYREYNGVPLKPSASKACIHCGRCAAECPVGAIPLTDLRATDKQKCISCMHCVAICPSHARTTSRLVSAVAAHKMKKTCSERKENKLYQSVSAAGQK